MKTEYICHYQVVKQLGKGGMGVVYLGKDADTDELVAIKALHQNLIEADGEWLARFIREGEALRDLNHPNIVKMLATCEEDGQHHIVMEYLDGGSLQERLAESKDPLPVKEVLDVALQMADALTRAHYLNIIHRDLKPANVLMSTDGRACITDFGVARTGTSQLTGDGVVLGTMGYLSPEVVQGLEATERSDIWSFGVVLFEMLTGIRPFSDQSPSGTLYKILSEPPPDLESLRPDIPIQLVDLVYRMLQKDAAQRISSVRQIGATLEMIGRDESSSPIAEDIIADLHETPSTGDSTRARIKLPPEWTPFIGRERELADLAELLVEKETRLVTVVGQGGIGKTRLAIETGRATGDRFVDGVAFIPLAALDTVDSLIPAIWEAVDYPPVHADSRTPEQQTIDFFAEKEMLLIFDNCEHLLDGIELAVRLLSSASGVSVLATTTERLNLRGETIYRLEGIDFPGEEANDGALDYPAVQLFIETSRRWRPGFEVNDKILAHIVSVCQLVQGLPLGILLAAAWVNVLSVEEIAREIGNNLDFLASEMRDIPDRQRSIRAVFESSWRRLSPADQEVFRRLAIFRGGFDLDAARVVTGANVRNLLSLTNKSLLWREPTSGRFSLHRLLRQFAKEELDRCGELAAIQRRHAEYYADLAEEIDQRLREPHELPWYKRIREENDNFIAALDWSLVQENAPTIGGRLFAVLAMEWFLLDNVADGSIWMERSLKFIDTMPDRVQARVYKGCGLIGCVQGNYAQAAAHHAQAVQRFRRLGEEGHLAHALLGQANMSYAAGMGKAAYRLAEESLNAAYRSEEPVYLAGALSTAARFSRRSGDSSRARRLMQERVKLAEAFPNHTIRCGTLRYQAGMARDDGDFVEALAKFEEALMIARALKWRPTELDIMEEMAYTYYLTGDYDRAVSLFSDVLERGKRINHFGLIVWNLIGLGMIELLHGSRDRARAMFAERLLCQSAEEYTWQIAICLAGIGRLAWLDGQEREAAMLLGASESMVKSADLLPFPWFTNEWQHSLHELKPKLDGDLWDEGGNLPGPQAIDYALSVVGKI